MYQRLSHNQSTVHLANSREQHVFALPGMQQGLQNAVEQRQHLADILHGKLQGVIRSAEGLDNSQCFDNVLSELVSHAEKFRVIFQELQSLYEQDKFEDYKGETSLTDEYLTLNHTYVFIDKIRIKQSKKQLESLSHQSRHLCCSKSISSSYTTRSTARMRALAEAATAHQNAEYEHVIAEKEHARRECKWRSTTNANEKALSTRKT